AAARHRPRRAVGRQRQAGRVLLHARLRLHRGRLRRPRDRRPRSRQPRAPAGPRPARALRRAAVRSSDRRAPAQARRRREGHRAGRPGRRPRLQGRARARGQGPRRTVRAHRRARHRAPRRHRDVRRDRAPLRRPLEVHRRVPPRLPAHRALRRGQDRRHARRDRPHRRQRRARRDAAVGRVLRAGLRDDGDDPLLRRGHLDRVQRAHVEGRDVGRRPREVPDQRARRGQAQVADRRVPRLLRGRGRAAHRARHARHRRHGHEAPGARRPVPHGPGHVLRRGAGSRPRDEGGPRGPPPPRDPRRPRRRGLPAADLHQAARRPPDDLLRDHRAPRRARLRGGQLQGSVRGDRARAGQAREPL
ncbi:MAG: 4-hydroxyphenylpyruvate dioxygenase, partial [uncultured Solirubrobacteraceae bacterium]